MPEISERDRRLGEVAEWGLCWLATVPFGIVLRLCGVDRDLVSALCLCTAFVGSSVLRYLRSERDSTARKGLVRDCIVYVLLFTIGYVAVLALPRNS